MSNGEDNTHLGYNHIIAIANYYRIQQERYQSLQEFCDQLVAYRKVCEQSGIKVGASENGGDNILKRMNITNPTQQQKDDAEKKAIEEHHAILFAKKIRSLRQLERQVTYFLNGRTIMVENTTMGKVTRTMVWPLQQ